MPKTINQIERYLDDKLNHKLREYSSLLNQLQDTKNINFNHSLTTNLADLKKEIDLLIEIIYDIGLPNLLNKYDIVFKRENDG